MPNVNYNQPGTISLVIDSADMGGTPPVKREIIVLGDHVTSANLAKVNSKGGLLNRPDPSAGVNIAHTPVELSATAITLVKNSPGSLFGVYALNMRSSTRTTSQEICYLHFFNTTTTAALSTTNWLFAIPMQSPNEFVIGQGAGVGAVGRGEYSLGFFSNGIVIVGAAVSTSTTLTGSINPPVGVVWIE